MEYRTYSFTFKLEKIENGCLSYAFLTDSDEKRETIMHTTFFNSQEEAKKAIAEAFKKVLAA